MKSKYVVLVFVGMLIGSPPVMAGKRDPMDIPAYERIIATNGAPVSAARVKSAIVTAGTRRGWMVADSEPGRITLRYAPRDHEVVVAVRYDNSGYKIEYVSSKDMNYKEKAGGTVIHGNYNRWIRNLASDIQASPLFHQVEGAGVEEDLPPIQ